MLHAPTKPVFLHNLQTMAPVSKWHKQCNFVEAYVKFIYF